MRFWNFVRSLIVLLFLLLMGCQKTSSEKAPPPGLAMVVSLSTDGRYAVSSHEDKRLILWDLVQHRETIISGNANIYSAFFVPRTNVFIWQDLNDIVHVQSLEGTKIQSFQHFPTYGHALTRDLKNYVSCDQNWKLYLGHGETKITIKNDGRIPDFIGTGKLLNLSLSSDGKYLLSAGDGFSSADKEPISGNSAISPKQRYSNYAGVVLWDLLKQKPVYKFPGHSAKTTAILSPDGKYVVSGDESGVGFVWNAKTGEQSHEIASIFHGKLDKHGSKDYEKWTYDKTGLLPPPSDLGSKDCNLAFRFIGPQHYLRFLTYSPYAVLYHIDNPLPLKYLPLGREPFPAVSDYPRNAAMDTAPEAGILVMGQRDGGGIIVYKYHPEKQELERLWVAE